MEDAVAVQEKHEEKVPTSSDGVGWECGKVTMDGSITWKGFPAAKNRTGGWAVGSLLLVNQGLTMMAFYGIGVNLVVFMTKVLRQDNANAANNVSRWMGTSNIFSLLGAFISDSYWGRYKTCIVFQVVFVLGLILLSLSSYLLLLKPCIPGDGTPHCEPPTAIEIWIFYLAIYQTALGIGSFQPSITTFGADQFDAEDPKEANSKVAFFSYFYIATNIGTLVSTTILVYVQDKGKWALSFWICAGVACVALLMLLAGTPRYRNFRPGGNPLSRFCQVIFASIRKWKAELPADGVFLYEVEEKECTINGGKKILHTPDFRFLDRAAVVMPQDLAREDPARAPSAWHLCTTTQVEEVKCILRLLPIWLCSIVYSIDYNQMTSVFIEQGSAMDTRILSFDVPPASVSIFEIIGVTLMVPMYRLCVVPLVCRMGIGKGKGLTELQRMGVGLVLATFGMVSSGIVETLRLKRAINCHGGCRSTSSLSIMSQIPAYILLGASEIFMYVGQIEFFNSQTPDGLKSFGSALYVASMAMGSYASSLLVTVVMKITRRGEHGGWIPDNLNKGHMDYFFYLLAGLTALDFIVFISCTKRYRYISVQGKSEADDDK